LQAPARVSCFIAWSSSEERRLLQGSAVSLRPHIEIGTLAAAALVFSVNGSVYRLMYDSYFIKSKRFFVSLNPPRNSLNPFS
jgi:hypothetical protein